MLNEPDLPDWVEVRGYQQDAVDEIVEKFHEGNRVVFLDAPTGAGKTLLGELVRRRLNPKNTLYVCSDKSLQDQFARDFTYAKVLKGRSNYPTQSNPKATAADCTAVGGKGCWNCEDGHDGCPYQIAKKEALWANLATTNTAYFLTEANHVGRFSKRGLVIADEADTLEGMLMNFVEFTVGTRMMGEARMDMPKKGARKTTLQAWLRDYAQVMGTLASREEEDVKRAKAMKASAEDAIRVADELQRDITKRQADADDDGMWLRDYDHEGRLILKPVMVSGHGTKNLWKHGERFLCMSATIISSDEMADSLGLPLDYATVTVPMMFPKENRPIIMAPVANVVRGEMDQAVVDLGLAIARIRQRHHGERMLVHTVSYDLTRKLELELKAKHGLKVITYGAGKDRDAALQKYKALKGAVLLAPSMERGIDLPDDLCRVQVIAKVPFPSLGDKQISARMHLPGGQMWYTVQTVRDVVQMAGRAVRHKEDHATTYVLDRQFARNLWAKNRQLFPGWFREAVDTGSDIRWMMR